jgi:hypothetical protein
MRKDVNIWPGHWLDMSTARFVLHFNFLPGAMMLYSFNFLTLWFHQGFILIQFFTAAQKPALKDPAGYRELIPHLNILHWIHSDDMERLSSNAVCDMASNNVQLG